MASPAVRRLVDDCLSTRQNLRHARSGAIFVGRRASASPETRAIYIRELQSKLITFRSLLRWARTQETRCASQPYAKASLAERASASST